MFTSCVRQETLCRRELDILEVYDAEGWRGSNKDKLKPRAEMQRAEKQVTLATPFASPLLGSVNLCVQMCHRVLQRKRQLCTL